MLENITLKYFRKHEDISVGFVGGLNIIKAGNEEGKCLEGNTRITTTEGYTLLKDFVKDPSPGWNTLKKKVLVNGNVEIADRLFFRPNVPTIKVSAARGFSVTATEDHKLLTWDKESCTHVFKQVKDLTCDDYLCIDKTILHEGSSKLSIPKSKVAEFNYSYVKVTSVKPDKVQDVYDLCVPNKHMFVANGIVSHNSTLVEGLGYNWFGSASLREPLKDVVTHGEKVSKLRTETTTSFNGVKYRVTRSGKGAEIYLNDSDKPKVTGQKEVTSYMEDLFGVPAGKASALIIAEQGDIRGVLSKGAADTSKFIESMANFDDIDLLVNKVQSALSFGSNQSEKDRLLLAEEDLANLEEVSPPDEKTIAANKVRRLKTLEPLNTELESLKADLASIDEVISANKGNQTMRDGLLAQIKQFNKAASTLGDSPEPPKVTYDLGKHQANTKRADEVSLTVIKAQADLIAFAKFKELKLSICEDEWDEPYQSLLDEIQATTEAGVRIITELAQLNASVEAKKLSIMTDDLCPTCGSKPDTTVVERNNLAVIASISECEADIVTAEAKKEEQRDYLTALEAIKSSQEKIINLSQMFPANIILGPDTQVPSEIKFSGWKYQPTELIDELESLNLDSAQFEAAKTACEKYDKAYENFEAKKDNITAGKLVAEKALSDIPADKPVTSTAKLREQIASTTSQISTISATIAAEEEDHRQWQAKYETYAATKARMDSTLQQAKAALAEKDLANLLLKDIRAARNTVTNNIWSTILKVVSVYFSKMRGEVSNVTRGEKTFLVNGKSTKGLSGSTLDILGLAFRIAQSELFLSGCPVLFLDEATAGCDADRSSSMIGLLSGAVDKQCVLITHSDVGPDVCEHLITIGEVDD